MLVALKQKRQTLLIFTIVCLIFLAGLQPAFAQSSTTNGVNQAVEGAATMGVATLVTTNLKNVKDGSILSNSPNGAILSKVPYDPQVVGVVSRDAAIFISNTSNTNAVPVIANGNVYMLVSSQQGNIKKGDYLTTSTIPGIAVKANDAGYVLGTALEGYSNPNKKQTELIAVNLDLHYYNTKPTFVGTLTDILKIALLPSNNATSPLWKYIVAAAVALSSLVLAFLTFGRTAAKGVEALGRNPSASKIIHLGIIFNVGIVVVIVLAGLSVAFMILRL